MNAHCRPLGARGTHTAKGDPASIACLAATGLIGVAVADRDASMAVDNRMRSLTINALEL